MGALGDNVTETLLVPRRATRTFSYLATDVPLATTDGPHLASTLDAGHTINLDDFLNRRKSKGAIATTPTATLDTQPGNQWSIDQSNNFVMTPRRLKRISGIIKRIMGFDIQIPSDDRKRVQNLISKVVKNYTGLWVVWPGNIVEFEL